MIVRSHITHTHTHGNKEKYTIRYPRPAKGEMRLEMTPKGDS